MLYRFQYTMLLSFLHRVTGCAMSVGLLLFVYWLTSMAGGAESYEQAQGVFAHVLVKLALVGFSFAFFYHLLNGVRHLSWDTGRGFQKKTARLSGWIVFLGALVLTASFWILVCVRLGGAA